MFVFTNNSLPFFKCLKFTIIFILIFSISVGITFPVMAFHINTHLKKNVYINTKEENACYIYEEYLLCLANDRSEKRLPERNLSNPKTYNISLNIELEANLAQGWNLISLPINPDNNGIQSVLESLGNNYNSVWTYYEGGWKYYIPGIAGNKLTIIEPGRGYWIKMNKTGTLKVKGDYAISVPIQLTRGWNLVGYNSLTPRTAKEALTSIKGLYWSVWTYSDNNWLRRIEGF